jgi:hypothetical protein
VSPLAAPPADLRRFPSFRLTPARALCRVHRRDRGPWWFSHDGSGRFDLPPPRGTCYLAESPLGAFVEVFREIALVFQAVVDARRVSTLRVPAAVRLADCTRARAFGLTAEIHATEEYAATQRWAAAFAAAGFAGVRYLVRHDPSARSVGVALFGAAGETGLGPVELARANVFFVSLTVVLMVLIVWLLARYNMRWIARRAAGRRESGP